MKSGMCLPNSPSVFKEKESCSNSKLLSQVLSSRLLINGGTPVSVRNTMVDPQPSPLQVDLDACPISRHVEPNPLSGLVAGVHRQETELRFFKGLVADNPESLGHE